MTSTQNNFQRRSHSAQHKSQATKQTTNWRCSLVAYLPPLMWITLGSLPGLAQIQINDGLQINDGASIQVVSDEDEENLFDSFEQFWFDPGQIENFESAPQIENIVRRIDRSVDPAHRLLDLPTELQIPILRLTPPESAPEIETSQRLVIALARTDCSFSSAGDLSAQTSHILPDPLPDLLYSQGIGVKHENPTDAGAVHYYQGEYARAIDCYEKSLTQEDSSQDSTQDARRRGQALGGLGVVYYAMGNYDRAIEYNQQSREIARASEFPKLEAIVLRNLGLTYHVLEDYDRAIDYQQQSLDIARENQDRVGEGRALSYLGLTHYFLTDYTKSIEYQQQSLEIAKEIQDLTGEGLALENLGWAYYALEDYDRAIDFHRQSLALAQQIGNSHAEGRALHNLGDALFQAGQFPEATLILLVTLEIWESLRSNVGNDDSNKISIFETQEMTYGLLQEVLVSHEQYDTALEVAERGRARAFIELVSQRRAPQSLQLEIAPPQLEKIQQIARTQNATLVSYSVIQDVVEADGIRQERDSALYIWVVEPNGDMAFRQVDLKPQQLSLQELIHNSRELIGVRSSEDNSKGEIVPGDLVKLNDDVSYWEPWQVIAVNPEGNLLTLRQSSFSEGVSIERPISDVVTKVERLHAQHPRLQQLHELLVEPISDLLPTNPDDRVIFVPHRELFRVPFAALQDTEGMYLIEKHTILTAPAIQVLEFHQSEEEKTKAVLPALIVGNPTMPELSFGDVSSPLAPLPHAEREARDISQLLQTDVLIGERATTATVLEQLPNARIVHLATHGLLDERTGMGSAIALAPSESDDGWLSAAEIFDLSLDAELVVLSACNTGQGKITGDGVIGLSRSFLSAGAKSLIVSLWMVPDAPTADLMTAFYQHFQENFDKARALRQAMLTTMEQHPHPRNWAAFVLVGES